jgi:hypothetical protein
MMSRNFRLHVNAPALVSLVDAAPRHLDAALIRHPENGRPVRRVILGGIGILKSSGASAGGPASGGCGCGPTGCC